MNKRLLILFAAALSLGLLFACSKEVKEPTPITDRDPAINVAPLGVEVGYTNLVGLKEKLGNIIKIDYKGQNEVSNGVMMFSDGLGLGLKELNSILFIFNRENILVGVVMEMKKDMESMNRQLLQQYTPITSDIDDSLEFGNVRYEKGDSFVEVDAQKESDFMELRFRTKQFQSDIDSQKSEAPHQAPSNDK